MRKQGVIAVITAAVMSVGVFFMTGVSAKAEDGATALSEMQAEESAETEEKTDGDWRYRVLEDGTAEITGYDGEETDIEIPGEVGGAKVTSLGYNIFDKLETYESVTVPKSVTSIDDNAFGFWEFDGISGRFPIKVYGYLGTAAEAYAKKYGHSFIDLEGSEWGYFITEDGTVSIFGRFLNRNEENVVIPAQLGGLKVTIVGQMGSEGNVGHNMKTIVFPETIEEIGDCAFYGCSKLEKVSFGKSILAIGASAFGGCTALESIDISNGSIYTQAFQSCTALKNAVLNGANKIGYSAFSGCTSLESVSLEGVKEILNSAFEGCKSLKSVEIPDSVTTIEKYAFGYIWDSLIQDYTKLPDFTIYGYPGTAAEAYAKENGFTFIEIKDEPVEEPTQTPSNTEITVNASGELSPELETAKDEILSAVAKYLSEDELSAVRAGASALEIKLSVTSLDGEISESDKELIANAVNDISDGAKLNFKVMNYLDIKLHASIDGRELNVAETDGLLTVSVELENPANGIYKVIRIHDGKAEAIDAQLDKDGKRLSFATDKFSTYAIAYSDVASGDSTGTTIVIIAICIAGLSGLAAGTATALKKRCVV